MHLNNTTAKSSVFLHLGYIVQQEQKLTITGTRNHCHLLSTLKICIKSSVEDFLFSTHFFRICFPTLTIRRIRQHEIKLTGRILIGGERRTKSDMLRLIPIPL